jgi:hypothetical protein
MTSYRLARRRCPITEVLTEQETIAHPSACRPRHGRNLRIQTAVRLRDRHRSSDDRCLTRAGVEINAFVTTGNAATADANIAECLGPANKEIGDLNHSTCSISPLHYFPVGVFPDHFALAERIKVATPNLYLLALPASAGEAPFRNRMLCRYLRCPRLIPSLSAF